MFLFSLVQLNDDSTLNSPIENHRRGSPLLSASVHRIVALVSPVLSPVGSNSICVSNRCYEDHRLTRSQDTETSDPVILANVSDFSQFNKLYRSNFEQFIVFFGRTVAKRTPPTQYQSVKHEEYKVHAYNRNGLCVVGFMDDHYPIRSAFSLLDQILDEYQKNFGETWRSAKADCSQEWPYLREALNKFQDSVEADKLLKIQRELDETMTILHKTIDGVLARGEKLDNLVEMSSDLSFASQMFYKQAKKTNSCCTIL